jgi:hypothetical protein
MKIKKLLLLSFVLLNIAFAGFSQTTPPSFINYQKVLFDVNAANPNAPLSNQSFTTFVNINDELGNLLYREEHFASTDANGLITVKMGDGLYTAGSITNFNQINWGVGKYYLVIDFVINGTTSSTAPEQLVTVPYSYFAGRAGNGMTAVADNGNGTLTFTYANGTTYITPVLSGITGAQGIAGTNGTNGAIGPQGPQGAEGPQGMQGQAGTYTAGTGIIINNNEISVNSAALPQASQGVRIGFASSTTWTCPAGVAQITVELWGGGGAAGYNCCRYFGGFSSTAPYGLNLGGYGGNGGYVKTIANVIAGQSYSIVVGAGGSIGSMSAPSSGYNCSGFTYYNVTGGQNGGNGGDTKFNNSIISSGGTGGASANSSVGGQSGTNGAIINFTNPLTNLASIPNYIPTNYLTAMPTGLASGGQRSTVCDSNGNYLSGGNGQIGYCVISY